MRQRRLVPSSPPSQFYRGNVPLAHPSISGGAHETKKTSAFFSTLTVLSWQCSLGSSQHFWWGSCQHFSSGTWWHFCTGSSQHFSDGSFQHFFSGTLTHTWLGTETQRCLGTCWQVSWGTCLHWVSVTVVQTS